MIAFDTDVVTQILHGTKSDVDRAAKISRIEQCVPIVVLEEILRGRLQAIRRAENQRRSVELERSYHLLQRTFEALRDVWLLAFTAAAEDLFTQWRQQKIRVATLDLRIAAICVVHQAKLVSRNSRDFSQVPGLSVEYW
jgi:tRNA(fMet)-specific endonuclease VapC